MSPITISTETGLPAPLAASDQLLTILFVVAIPCMVIVTAALVVIALLTAKRKPARRNGIVVPAPRNPVSSTRKAARR